MLISIISVLTEITVRYKMNIPKIAFGVFQEKQAYGVRRNG
jgi:hypothetical protein